MNQKMYIKLERNSYLSSGMISNIKPLIESMVVPIILPDDICNALENGWGITNISIRDSNIEGI